MVINARRMFRCSHTFVAVTEGPRLLFACASCGYRTELLPLERRSRPSQPAGRRRATGEGRHDGPARTSVALKAYGRDLR